jgi:hypothetical protein
VYTSTLTGRAHGVNGRRATSGSSIGICPRTERAPPFPTNHFLIFIRFSHICITMVMLHAGPKPERTLLALYQTILLIEFSYYVRHLVYVLRSMLAAI